MAVQDIFLKLGVGTWVSDIITIAPATPANTFQVGKNLPTDIGFIYGLSTYADGVDSQNNTLVTTAQCQNMYLMLKDGGTEFIEELRLSDLLNEFAGSPVVRPDKFTPVNIPVFDLSKSEYKNPLLFTGFSIHLKLWYVQKKDWKRIEHFFAPTTRPSEARESK